MIGAGCGSGVAVELHGVPGGGQSGEDSPHVGGIGEVVAERCLHQSPDCRIDRFDAEGVGGDPVGSGRNLRHEIGVTGGKHLGGRRPEDAAVGDDGERGWAGQGLFQSGGGEGGAAGGIAIDRRRGRDAAV